MPTAVIRPPVLILAPVTLPETDTTPPVKLATFTMLVNMPLLAVILPVILTNPPVKLATFTMLVNIPLLAVTLPVTLTNPPVKLATLTMLVNMPLLATKLPVTLADPPVTKLLPCILPVLVISPVTDNPSVAKVAMLELDATLTVTLLLLNTRTLLVPFDIAAESMPVSNDPLPRI